MSCGTCTAIRSTIVKTVSTIAKGIRPSGARTPKRNRFTQGAH